MKKRRPSPGQHQKRTRGRLVPPSRRLPVRHARPCCVLVSGGLDSIVLLREALRVHRSVQPLYVRAGMVWEPVERRALGRLLRLLRHPRLKPLRSIDVPMGDLLAKHWSASGRGGPGYDDGDASVFIPGRNIALFSKAATFCALEGIPALVSGILSANPFPDGSPRFLRAMERALATGLGAPFRITTPFRRLTKDRVVQMGRDLPLHLTFSCISPTRGRHCGDCCKCKERIDAFLEAGVPDRTRYAAGGASDGSAIGRSALRITRGRPTVRTRLAANRATSSR
ncbi:MAG TPA: 7-cyano-7-deazaguanine synthase [Verrucomicrobiae bacterium]|nr:7-cyano-7-deazaguanine synthase [Verrucomicrobiae bacterium]